MTPFAPRLRDRVASIQIIENEGGEATVLPTAGAVLGFQLRGRVRHGETLLSRVGVTGIQRTARRYTYVGPTASLLVRFTPQGAACLGVPASQLSSQSVALDELLRPTAARGMLDRLLEAKTAAEGVAVMEQFLLGLPFTADPLVERACQLLGTDADEEALVASVARELSVSERQLERRFLERIGISPKRYASLCRLERVVELARSAPSLTHAALEAGYYDQSHFIREFRRFAGGPPRELLRQTR